VELFSLSDTSNCHYYKKRMINEYTLRRVYDTDIIAETNNLYEEQFAAQ
jgi:hypothetical protein